MEKMKHKLITLSYKLYVIEDDQKGLAEMTTAEKPENFISGFGLMLDEFERQVVDLQAGNEFDFTLSADEAFGKYDPEAVLELERDEFVVDGHFDHEHIYKGAFVPLENEVGDRFMSRVTEVGENKVKLDLNHPYAGKSLQYVGQVLETRDATDEEIVNLIKGGGCGSCAGCDDEAGGSCCGHCH